VVLALSVLQDEGGHFKKRLHDPDLIVSIEKYLILSAVSAIQQRQGR